MDLDLNDSELCLAHNTPVRLRRAKGVRVTCTQGLLWLTVEGEAGDIVLAPGDSYLIRSCGLGLLEAVGTGRARLQRVQGRSSRQWIRRWAGFARWEWSWALASA